MANSPRAVLHCGGVYFGSFDNAMSRYVVLVVQHDGVMRYAKRGYLKDSIEDAKHFNFPSQAWTAADGMRGKFSNGAAYIDVIDTHDPERSVERMPKKVYLGIDTQTFPEYSVWAGIKERCYRKKSPAYYRYGGRGIEMCAEWLNSFETFLADMGRRPSKDHSIDRIDNNDNYSAANCRWATSLEQQRNMSSNRPCIIHGVFYKCMTVASETTGIPIRTVDRRLRAGTPGYILLEKS